MKKVIPISEILKCEPVGAWCPQDRKLGSRPPLPRWDMELGKTADEDPVWELQGPAGKPWCPGCCEPRWFQQEGRRAHGAPRAARPRGTVLSNWRTASHAQAPPSGPKWEQDQPLMLWLPWVLPREPALGSQSPAAHCTGLYPRILQAVDVFLRGFYTVKLKELPLLILILRAYFAHHLRSAVTRGVWGGNRRQKSEGITPKDSSLRAPPSSPEYGELGHRLSLWVVTTLASYKHPFLNTTGTKRTVQVWWLSCSSEPESFPRVSVNQGCWIRQNSPLKSSSGQFSRSVVSDSLRPHEPQHARPPCPSQLPESTQTHVHPVSDAIQPSHPLSSPFPHALSLSQHQGRGEIKTLQDKQNLREFITI